MTSRPLAIGVLAVGSSVVGASAFAWNPGRYDQSAAIVVLIGTIIVGITGFAGLVLVRAPWARWTLLVIVIIGMILASVPGSWAFWVAIASGGIAAVGLLGPWLRLWVRRAPAADAPGPVVVALIAIGPAAALYVGLGALGGLHGAHVLLIVLTMVSSWAFGRGLRGGLWGLRLAFPIAGAAAVAATAGAGAISIGVAVLTVTILAWLPHARRATAVITPPLPQPITRTPRSRPNAYD